MPNAPHAFISYSRKDTAFVERLEHALNARGVVTWRDATSIPGGDDWYQNIVSGLANAYAVICIVTPNADESKWVRREQLRADEDGIPPLAVHPAKYRNPLHLQEVQPILMDDAGFDAGLAQLTAALHRCRSREGAVSRPVTPAVPDDTALIREYLKWVLSDAKADLRDALYVDLAATPERAPEVRMKSALAFGLDDDFDFSAVGIEQVRGEDFGKPGDDVPDARIAIRDLRRAVLLGDPGAGKTTTLLKLVVDLARAAQDDPAAKLPLYIPLREFDGSTTFDAFVRAKAHNLQSAFDRLRGRFVLLCDALNEMPRTAKSDGRDLIAEVRGVLANASDWVVSCRVRDYTDDLSSIAGIGKIRLKPLDPPRIHDFIQRKYAGWGLPERGDALWRDLRGSDTLLKAWAAFVAHGAPDLFWERKWLPDEPGWWSDEGNAWDAMHADHRRLLALCRSPFLVNMVCVLYRQAERLPENRAGLYAGFVANLLRSEEKRRGEVGLAWIGEAPIRTGLGQVAWAMGAQTEMARADAEAILRTHVPDIDPAVLLSAAASAGLIDYGTSVRFTHQLLQQYFAAAVLGALMDGDGVGTPDARTPDARTPRWVSLRATDIWRPETWWESTGREETAILLAGDRNDPQGVARWIAPAQPHLALELLQQPDFALDLRALDASTRTALIDGANAKTNEPNPVGRAAAYRVLGWLDADKRPGVGVVALSALTPHPSPERGVPLGEGSPDESVGDNLQGQDESSGSPSPSRTRRSGEGFRVRASVAIPDILWCDPIADNQTWIYQDGEHPPLPPYQISKYPVTNAQFQTFLDDKEHGYNQREWWTDAGWQWKGRRTAPAEYRTPAFRLPNHPRIDVTWYEAVAFCNWLTWRYEQAGLLPSPSGTPRSGRPSAGAEGGAGVRAIIRLPTEQEWERAARGTDGREYPYKGKFDARKGNTDETGIGMTSAVGIFPNGASPCSALDMSGNVWEWCLTQYKSGSQVVDGTDLRALRGGSWDYRQVFARAASRNFSLRPYLRNLNLGFRVALVVPHLKSR
ncbi:MAG: SUMF1/EgtB/PvdO family nonheme iron enzyme [Chloroflexota bacterium]|nr:SUMF1/EgtB/PvdO family nonheme iron enzyme [Chloroflexota bacterium]